MTPLMLAIHALNVNALNVNALAVDNGLNSLAPLANITVVGALIVVVIWMVTRGFPRLLERSDASHAAARGEFLAALEKQTDSRSAAAKSGHEVAARMELDLQAMAGELRRANDLRIHELRSQQQPQASPSAEVRRAMVSTPAMT